MTDRNDIQAWLREAKHQSATHLIVATDDFDHDDYPVYVMPGEDPRVRAQSLGKMQRVMEVYAMHLDLEDQLAEHRSFHYESAPKQPPPKKSAAEEEIEACAKAESASGEALQNARRWDALASLTGYNELAKEATTMGAKMYLRMGRDAALENYVKLGGEVRMNDPEPLVIVNTRPPFLALTPRDIELMRDAIAEYDQKAFSPKYSCPNHGVCGGSGKVRDLDCPDCKNEKKP